MCNHHAIRITLNSGSPIFIYVGEPWTFDLSALTIHDIAWGLSNICRFSGQTVRHYSVAEHSINVSEALDTPWSRMLGLLHDATECLGFGDMNGSLKKFGFPEIKKAEDLMFAAVIRHLFDRTDWYDPRVHEADKVEGAREFNTVFDTYYPTLSPSESYLAYLAQYAACLHRLGNSESGGIKDKRGLDLREGREYGVTDSIVVEFGGSVSPLVPDIKLPSSPERYIGPDGYYSFWNSGTPVSPV